MKKGGNFKNDLLMDQMVSFLFCLCSKTWAHLADRDKFKIDFIFHLSINSGLGFLVLDSSILFIKVWPLL